MRRRSLGGSALAQPAPKRKRGAREAEIADGTEHFLTREDGLRAGSSSKERMCWKEKVECAQFRCVERGCTYPLSHLLVPKTKGRGTFSRKTDFFKTHAALHVTDCKTVKLKHDLSLGSALHGVELYSLAFSLCGREAARVQHDDEARLDEWARRHLESCALVDGRVDGMEPTLVLDARPEVDGEEEEPQERYASPRLEENGPCATSSPRRQEGVRGLARLPSLSSQAEPAP